MEFIRKHKTLSTIVLLFLVIFLLVGVTYGRYIKNIIDEYILETKAFYFNSSILTVNGKNLSISNWDGVNSYTLTIDLNNRKSATKYTTTDIEYNISVNCPDTVVCTLNKTSGILRSTDTNDTYQIVVTPQRNFYEGDTVRVQTSVSSTIPYQKTMSATYTIGVQSSDFSYNIEDSVNSKYLNLNFVNSVSYYEVEEAFSNYAVGDLISLSDYQALSASDKAKCFSAKVTVEFDPEDLFVDMTNDLYLNRIPGSEVLETINGYQYVKKFSFKIDASSSSSLLFYKDDITNDYTYPIVNNTSIVSVNVVKAN